MKQITSTSTRRFFDGVTNLGGLIFQTAVSPGIKAYAGTASDENGNLTINTYGIVRSLFNGASSKLQVNETTATTGDFGASDMDGFTLGSESDGSLSSNIEVKEIIIRKVADGASDEQEIYDYLDTKYFFLG